MSEHAVRANNEHMSDALVAPRSERAPLVPVASVALGGAGVLGGVVIGSLVGAGYWYVALVLILTLPAFVLLHRHPLVAIAVWLFVSPLVSTTDGSGVRQVYWVVHRALPVAALAALAVSTLVGLRTRALPRLGWPEVLMGGYVVLTLLSIGYTAPDALANTYILYDTVVIPMCLYLLVRLAVPDEADVRRLVPAIVFILVTQAAVGLLSWKAPGLFPDEWTRKAGQRTTGTLRSADVFGTTMVFCGLFLLHVGVRAQRPLRRVGAITLFLLAMLMVFLSFSRASWLAALVAATGALLIDRRHLGQLALVVAPIAVFVWASGLLTQQFDLAEYRFSSAQSEESALSRLPAAQAALRMFDREPAVGWGYQNFDLYSRPFQGQVGDLVGAAKPHASHNLYLTVLAEQGVFGLVLLVGPVVVWLLRTRAALPYLPRAGLLGRDFVLTLWLIVAAYHVTNNFSRMYVTTGLGLFWLTLGLVAAVVERYRPRTAPAGGIGTQATTAGVA
jgi:O-antigen ligase